MHLLPSVRLHALGSCAALLLLAGCDREPPPEPTVAPVSSPTSLPTQILTGSAEFGALVRVTGGSEAVTTTADPFTAAFWIEVPLQEGAENTLRVTATDDAENESAATEVVILHEVPHPETLDLSVTDPIVDSDDGTLTASVVVGNDEPIDLAGFDVTFSVAGYDGAANVVVQTDSRGRAEAEFTGLTTVGGGTLTATAGDLVEDADFVVVGGIPYGITLNLSGASQGPATAITVPPDTEITAAIVVTDEAANVLDVPVTLVTDAPDALVSGRTIRNVTRAGAWTVAAAVLGSPVAVTADLTVEAGDPATVEILAVEASVLAGETFSVETGVTDAWGNPLPAETVTLTLDPSPTAPTTPIAGDEVTIESPAGLYTVTATLDSDTDIDAEVEVEVLPAAPTLAGFSFDLDDTDDVTPNSVLDVYAATDVDFDYAVLDAYGNAVPGAVVDVTLNAPGAIVLNDMVSGGTLQNLLVSGDYTVAAQVRGLPLVHLVPLEVLPAAPADIVLDLLTTLVPVGEAVPMEFTVYDAFGNEVQGATVGVASSDPAATWSGDPDDAIDGDTVTFSQPGNFSVTATEDSSGATSTRWVSVTEVIDFVPPTVTIVNPVDEAEFQPGSPVIVRVTATDQGGLLRVGFLTTGIVEESGIALQASGTQATTETFSFVLPSNLFGQVTIQAYAEDEGGNQSNAAAVTITAQYPNDIVCATCDDVVTAAAGFEQGGFFPEGDEGGIRDPREVAVGDGGEIYVAMGANVIITQGSGFLGTDDLQVYISVILPNGAVENFATVNSTSTQNAWGLAYSHTDGTLFASVSSGTSRVQAFTMGGLVDPYSDLVGDDRERGIGWLEADSRLVAAHWGTIARLYAVDPSSTETTLSSASYNDACDDGAGTLYLTAINSLLSCTFTPGTPSTCTGLATEDTGGLLTGTLNSCVVAPSGMVYFTNTTTGAVLAFDPSGTTATAALATGFVQPFGIDVDDTNGDLVVSDYATDAVFRLKGIF